MQFLYQPLTWGFLLVGVPILIHLINMLRHRRVKWAAMDFLLESHRRNRRWVMLKQWLLLASRILAMFLLVLMLAKWISGSEWLSWIGGQTTHHYVLLDDSYSMDELDQNETAYSRALRAVTGLVRSVGGRQGQHQVTLVRWSRAALAMKNNAEVARLDSAADLLGQSVPADPEQLLERINATEPSSLALSPVESLELISPLISENAEQKSIVYLVTDMRRNEFGEPDGLRNQLQSLTQNSADIQLVDCSQTVGSNLSIVSLEPEQEVWAAGVPLMVRFQVRNRTGQAAKNVVVRLRSVSYAERLSEPQIDKPYSGEVQDLPAIVIDQISAGETASRQAQVIFGVPGNHVVEAQIEDDALAADNQRWCSVDIKQSQRVLLIDGEVDQSNAFFFENVVNPNPQLSTGIQVDKNDAAFLRDVAPEILSKYDVIALLDVPRMDAQAVSKLEDYCRSGGGLLQICGRNTNLKYVNDSLYRDGEGFFPTRLSAILEFQESTTAGEPQVSAAQHPVLAPLLQLESSPFFLLQIRSMFETQTLDPSVETVATGPEGKALLLDKSLGQGRVLTLLTGLTPKWSNWAQDPTFVVMALRTLGYLGSFRRPATSQSTGDSIEMVVAGEPVLPDAEILFPSRGEGVRIRLQRQVEMPEGKDLAKLAINVDLDGADRSLTDSLLRPGIFEAWMVNAQGDRLVKNFAHNVAASEGDLDRVSHSEFEQKMRGVPVKIQTAEAVSSLSSMSQDSIHSTLLMCLLGALLLGEQALAYSASYHAPIVGARP